MGSVNMGQSKSRNKSFIDPTQMQYLSQMWNQGSGFFGGGGANVDQGRALGFIDQIGNNPYMQHLQGFMQPNNQLVQQQIGNLQQNLGQQFNEQIMPGIASNAINTGGLGGSRQGVAQGIAARGMQQALQQGSTGIMQNAYNQALGATQYGANLQQQVPMMGMQALGQYQQMQANPYLWWSQMMGGPTTLNKGKSDSWNFGMSVGQGS